MNRSALRIATRLHRGVYRISRGRLLGRLGPMPVLELTTTGRKSGRPRTTMLSAPVVDGERLVLVASAGGSDEHPQWYLNLKADPDVSVTIHGRHRDMRARVADADEKADLWPAVVKAYRGYDTYRARTERDIPVVILEPR